MLSRRKVLHGLTRASLVGVFLLVLTASVSAQEAPKKPSDKSKSDDVKLVVENNNYWDIHVYALRAGIYRSLGVVPGLGQADFKIPHDLTVTGGDFQILADPIGQRISYLSGPIVLGTANEIDLMLQSDLPMSSFMLKTAR